jgi:uncharacterized protein YbgA (DUF1722 family)/uncharacterized protein YbbK (DUF523 family)
MTRRGDVHRHNASHARIRLGISSCLLGERVRYDGNHRHDGFITGTLGRYFEFVPLCPEVAIGLGVPRAPIRLVGPAAAPRAIGTDDPQRDVTEALAAYGRRMARALGDISGYIFKSQSPSCGLERVKIYPRSGMPTRDGRGVYAAAVLAARPGLPAEEEGRLNDPRLRENFIERVFCYRRWQALQAQGLSPARLVEFHTRHKFTLLAHGTESYRALGRLVARAAKGDIRALAEEYLERFMDALAHPATPARHANVMLHLMGYLKRELDAADKAELLAQIHAFRLGEAPLAAPLVLLRHHFRRHPHPYVARQTYLYPDPRELLLRSGA